MATQASDTTTNTTGKKARGASADDLAVIAQRAQAFTNASGVAIALNEGNAEEIVCRARSGASAPEIGAALRVEGSFTGLCIQTGKELRCDDCETDTRVDTAAIRALGIRSMVVAPIREDTRVVGVLAAFAPTPHAFTITHVAVLKTMADQISTMLQKQRNMRDEAPAVEIPRMATPAIVAKPAPAPAPPPVVIKSSTPAAQAAAPAYSKIEPIRSTPVEVVPLAASTHVERRVESAHRGNFGTFDSVADDRRKSGSKFMMIGVVAVIVIAAAATFAFLKIQKPASAVPAQHVDETANAQPAQTAASATSNPQPAASVPAAAAPTVIVPANPAPSSSKPEAETRKSGKAEKTSNSPAPAVAEKPQEVATLSNSSTSRIAQQRQDQSSPEVAPSFSVEAGSGQSLSSLARPMATSTPKEGAIEQSKLEPLQLIKTVPLVFPAFARSRNITGTVVVQLTVDKNGYATNLQFVSGPAVFRDAAFDAVRRYVFKPAKLNGRPIDQTTQIKLKFE